MATQSKWIDTLKQWGAVRIKDGIIHFKHRKRAQTPCQEFDIDCKAPKLVNYLTGRQSCSLCLKFRFVNHK